MRPQASASAPAAISRLPKLSMKALVIQASACGPPPRSRPMAGVARAPPAKLNGNISAAVQTASRVQARAGSGVGKSGHERRGRAA